MWSLRSMRLVVGRGCAGLLSALACIVWERKISYWSEVSHRQGLPDIQHFVVFSSSIDPSTPTCRMAVPRTRVGCKHTRAGRCQKAIWLTWRALALGKQCLRYSCS